MWRSGDTQSSGIRNRWRRGNFPGNRVGPPENIQIPFAGLDLDQYGVQVVAGDTQQFSVQQLGRKVPLGKQGGFPYGREVRAKAFHYHGPDGHDHLDWYMASGDGEIEGTEVAVRCGMQCNTEITFYPEGENRDQSIRKYTYRIDVQDLIKHAHGQFKRDRLKEGK